MHKLHTVSLEDKNWINEILSQVEFYTCEYPFGNIFSYGAKMEILVGEVSGCLVTKCIQDDYVMYCCPVGKGNLKDAFGFILSDAKDDGRDFEIFGISPDTAEFMSKNYGDILDIFPYYVWQLYDPIFHHSSHQFRFCDSPITDFVIQL